MDKLEKQKILLVDDLETNLEILKINVISLGAEPILALSGEEAIALASKYEFALILLDVQMPGIDGFKTANRIKTIELNRDTPIIFISAYAIDEINILQGYKSGCIDYITKPFDADILISKINLFLKLDQQRREIIEANKIINQQNKKLSIQATHDGLTGIYNRSHFTKLFQREISIAKRHHIELSILLIDIDYFKVVNDTNGHLFGDYVLKKFAELVQGMIRETDIFARYGGEEFIVILPGSTISGAKLLAEKIRQRIEKYKFTNGTISWQLTISIGVSSNSIVNSLSPKKLIHFADKGLYHAKNTGRNMVCVHVGKDAKSNKEKK